MIAAQNGEDALLKFRADKDRIQLLLLDMIMPKKTGNEVYEEIIRIQPGMKAVFISGYTPNHARIRQHRAKGLMMIQKPISPTNLLRKIRTILDVS